MITCEQIVRHAAARQITPQAAKDELLKLYNEELQRGRAVSSSSGDTPPTSSSVAKPHVKKFTESTKITRDVTDRRSNREGEFTSEFIPDDDDQVPGFTNRFTIPIAPTVASSEARFTPCKPPFSRLTDDEVQDAIEAINEATVSLRNDSPVMQPVTGDNPGFTSDDVSDFTEVGPGGLTPSYIKPTECKPELTAADQRKVKKTSKRSRSTDGAPGQRKSKFVIRRAPKKGPNKPLFTGADQADQNMQPINMHIREIPEFLRWSDHPA
jgi:hypothetical protein